MSKVLMMFALSCIASTTFAQTPEMDAKACHASGNGMNEKVGCLPQKNCPSGYGVYEGACYAVSGPADVSAPVTKSPAGEVGISPSEQKTSLPGLENKPEAKR